MVDDQQETVFFKTHTYLKEHIPGLLLFLSILCLCPSPFPLVGITVYNKVTYYNFLIVAVAPLCYRTLTYLVHKIWRQRLLYKNKSKYLQHSIKTIQIQLTVYVSYKIIPFYFSKHFPLTHRKYRVLLYKSCDWLSVFTFLFFKKTT